ncbi:MAG: hypothetical protein LAT82_02275 [Nanoarchaeota archaeon]|nr:hypothetical protein [Nanoarchaeota archaeon]
MFSKLFNSNRALIVIYLIYLILAGIILILSIWTLSLLNSSTHDFTNEQTCLRTIDNIENVMRSGNIEYLSSLYNEHCKVDEVRIRNEESFKNEIIKCNNRAQRMTLQKDFISNFPNLCIQCSDLRIETNSIIHFNQIQQLREFNNIETEFLEITIEDDNKNSLIFRIIDNKVQFNILSSQERGCQNFLN